MNKEKILPRHAAGIIELGESTLQYTAMFSCGKFLEIYTADKTFRVQLPKSIDLTEINPDVPWVSTPTDNVGSKNPIVARVLLQGNEILNDSRLTASYNASPKTILFL